MVVYCFVWLRLMQYASKTRRIAGSIRVRNPPMSNIVPAMAYAISTLDDEYLVSTIWNGMSASRTPMATTRLELAVSTIITTTASKPIPNSQMFDELNVMPRRHAAWFGRCAS